MGPRVTETPRLRVGGCRAVHPQLSLCSPAVPAPGDLQGPACVEVSGTCAENSKNITCPKGTTQCYSGYIHLSRGEYRRAGSKDVLGSWIHWS